MCGRRHVHQAQPQLSVRHSHQRHRGVAHPCTESRLQDAEFELSALSEHRRTRVGAPSPTAPPQPQHCADLCQQEDMQLVGAMVFEAQVPCFCTSGQGQVCAPKAARPMPCSAEIQHLSLSPLSRMPQTPSMTHLHHVLPGRPLPTRSACARPGRQGRSPPPSSPSKPAPLPGPVPNTILSFRCQ